MWSLIRCDTSPSFFFIQQIHTHTHTRAHNHEARTYIRKHTNTQSIALANTHTQTHTHTLSHTHTCYTDFGYGLINGINLIPKKEGKCKLIKMYQR